jgi:hypothetical protein
MRFLLLMLAVAVTAFGSDRKSLVNADPFCEYIGRWVELRRPVNVVERSGGWGGGRGVRSKRKADYGLIRTNWTNNSQVFGVLPVGHKVFITDVRDESWIDDEDIMAYGRTTLPWTGKEVTFAYGWGWTWTLRPAPWEPDNTPEQRGPPGKLPPHFDYPHFRPPAEAPRWGLIGCGAIAGQFGSTNANRKDFGVEKRVPDAPRVGDAPRIEDAPK